ncbi:MAG TPA: class I SAM-dependent methyltransferase [Alphaproteobacteria bacterium]|nr:class I SAM-dependent methyltransferase [Alphaproteobacteria bacterium]
MNEAFRARGKTFDDADVARCYAFRPPYPAELFEAVLARAPGRSALLDLGTGPGKIAGALAAKFEVVTAVDPSRPMLDMARDLWRNQDNIEWTCASAEQAHLTREYDLVTAGASIHWVDPAIVFPKLAQHMSDNATIAIVNGDFPKDPPWQSAWTAFVARTAARMGDKYDPENWRATYGAYEAWIDVELKQSFVRGFSQSIDDFIECQHSRASWARHKLGPALAEDFDAETRAILTPYARDGVLRFDVATDLTLGRPRLTPLTS